MQSGTPWAARARDWTNNVLNYLEPAGSHRNPTWANLDVMASDAKKMRGERPFVMCNLKVLDGLGEVVTFIQQKGLLQV